MKTSVGEVLLMTMSLNEKVALQQALDDVPESDRRVAYGNLLLVTLVAFRQATSEGGISIPEKLRESFEQEVISGIASILARYFELETPLLEVGDIDFNDVRRGLFGLRRQLLSSNAADDLSRFLSVSFSGKSDKSLIETWREGLPDIQGAMIRALHPEGVDDDDSESDEGLLSRMREESGGLAEKVSRVLNINPSEKGDAL